MPETPSRIDLLELDIDMRLVDLWREAAGISEWSLEVVAAFMRAANVIYDVPEGRPAWITIPVRLAVTVAMLVLLVLSVVIVVVTGGVARRAGHGYRVPDRRETAAADA